MFIGIAGLIGAGKSTFTKQLADHLGENWKAYFEPVETNPYLEDFYKDINRWTFNMQMFLLAHRFRQHQEVLWDPCHRHGGGVIQDRTIYNRSSMRDPPTEDPMPRHPALEDGNRWCKECGTYRHPAEFGQWTNALCRLHMRAYSRARHQRNGDPNAAERQRKRREAKTEKYQESVRRDYEKQKAKGWPAMKKWRAANVEQQRTYAREYQRRWTLNNPDKAAAKRHRRRAREAEAPGFHTSQELQECRETFDGRCVYCGTSNAWTFDHLVPLARGGSNFIWNLAPSCRSCNSSKNARDPIRFIKTNARTPQIKARLLAACEKGIQLAGGRYCRKPYEKVPLQSIIDDARYVQTLAGRLTETTLQAHGQFAVSTYRRRLGGMAVLREAIK